jgi:hypothetical protein
MSKQIIRTNLRLSPPCVVEHLHRVWWKTSTVCGGTPPPCAVEHLYRVRCEGSGVGVVSNRKGREGFAQRTRRRNALISKLCALCANPLRSLRLIFSIFKTAPVPNHLNL